VPAQTLSLDVRLSPPGFGSLRVRFAFAILAALAPISPLEGMGSPEPRQLERGRLRAPRVPGAGVFDQRSHGWRSAGKSE